MKFLFSAFPESFQPSFTRKKTKKRLNLAGSTLRPKLNNSLLYEGLRYEAREVNNRKRDASLIDRKFAPNKLNVEVVFEIATGIPLTKESISLEDIVSRHLYVTLFNMDTKQLVGNTCRIPAFWDPNYEDRWYMTLTFYHFSSSKLLFFLSIVRYFKKSVKVEAGYNSLAIPASSCIIRHATYDAKVDNNLAVCFEFVIGVRYS